MNTYFRVLRTSPENLPPDIEEKLIRLNDKKSDFDTFEEAESFILGETNKGSSFNFIIQKIYSKYR